MESLLLCRATPMSPGSSLSKVISEQRIKEMNLAFQWICGRNKGGTEGPPGVHFRAYTARTHNRKTWPRR